MRTRVPSLALLRELRIWHYHELWCRSQTPLRSCIAVAMVQAGSCSSDSTPSLVTSICCRCSLKKTKKKKKKKKVCNNDLTDKRKTALLQLRNTVTPHFCQCKSQQQSSKCHEKWPSVKTQKVLESSIVKKVLWPWQLYFWVVSFISKVKERFFSFTDRKHSLLENSKLFQFIY